MDDFLAKPDEPARTSSQAKAFLIRALALSSILLVCLPDPCLAEDQQTGGGDSLDEELSDLKEDDFPDLVSVDDKSEIMDELAFLEEAGMVELAARHRQEIGMSPSAITVITREDIQASGASTIPDLLRMVPGMDVVWVSPFFTAISARLFWTYENYYFLTLIDGREVNLELMGQPLWEVQPIFLDDIERIEIIRGPASSLYGANAVAGVVSITTRSIGDKTSAWAQVAGGDAGNFTLGARVAQRIGNWGLALSGGVDVSGMLVDFRELGKEVFKLRAVVEYRWSESESLLLDCGLARGSGPFPAGGGTMDSNGTFGNVRLSYQSERLRGQLYWIPYSVGGRLDAPLIFAGVRLAEIEYAALGGHMLNGEFQYTLPTFWEHLLIIAGGSARFSILHSDEALDARTYADINSSAYHQPGIDHWETRLGAFVHAEFSLTDQITATGGLRLDYNNKTKEFFSPRLAIVYQFVPGQFLRIGLARAFRMPTFFETSLHAPVSFPGDSPIQGNDQELFREFMTRVIGNADLANEKLLSFEVGYRGEFLDDRLSLSLELYANLFSDQATLENNIVLDEMGLPDLEASSFQFVNAKEDITILGGEFEISLDLSRSVSILASWGHRQVFLLETGEYQNESPKNLFTIGGRLRTQWGLVGSLFVHYRSDWWNYYGTNPDGLLEPYLTRHEEAFFLALARIGWAWSFQRIEAEAGLKMLLPISPFAGPLFRYHEFSGGETVLGVRYGGDELRRMVTAYFRCVY